jgi:hypothetical protein
MRFAIAQAAIAGLRTFEFLGKESQWTKLWTDEARPISSLRIYPLNAAGVAAIAGDAVARMRTQLSAGSATSNLAFPSRD